MLEAQQLLGLRNIEWVGDDASGHLRLLDQTVLPQREAYLTCLTVQDVWDAIKRLSVRGAPAIGIAAAYGCVIGVQNTMETKFTDTPTPDGVTGPESLARWALKETAEHLASSRPTAVNLFWALERMQRVEPPLPENLLAEAKQIHEEDAAMCQSIGEHALQRIKPLLAGDGGVANDSSTSKSPPGILTHCNAGALATGGIGTATAPMYLAAQSKLPFAIYADETRPLLQGSRLTAYELGAAGIDVTLICDDMAAHVMQRGRIRLVITGADRIAANGDAANKIGTYNLAVLAKHHDLPFFVAAPSSTFDFAITDGSQIPIEERAAEEITEGFGNRTAPANVKTYSPAFDVTPHGLITAIITEKGVIEPVDAANVERVLRG
ncbi:MAG: S-methyl-5-thioribose-1-phosphate isomerase [Rhodospirillales bacterium]|nr:S-methyl-5-thioribose-1-phosphate isomerase [Rhodospirillales bacterium]